MFINSNNRSSMKVPFARGKKRITDRVIVLRVCIISLFFIAITSLFSFALKVSFSFFGWKEIMKLNEQMKRRKKLRNYTRSRESNHEMKLQS
jgi:predicted membrane protein